MTTDRAATVAEAISALGFSRYYEFLDACSNVAIEHHHRPDDPPCRTCRVASRTATVQEIVEFWVVITHPRVPQGGAR
jgi:hypothetical protein